MAGTVQGVVQVILSARDKDLANNFKKASSEIQRFGEGVSSLTKWVVGLGAAFAGMRAVSFVADSMKRVSALNDEAAQLGITTESMSRLNYAAQSMGATHGELSGMMARFQVTMSKAAQGNKEAEASFKAIGLSIKDLIGKSTDEQLAIVSDGMNKLGDGTGKTTAAMELFGKSGTKLLSFLSLGSQGLKEMGDKADRLGLTISGVDAARAEAAVKALQQIDMITEGIGNQIAVAVSPHVMALANAFTDVIEQVGGMDVAVRKMVEFATTGARAIYMTWNDVAKAMYNVAGVMNSIPAAFGSKDAEARVKQLASVVVNWDEKERESLAKFDAFVKKINEDAAKAQALITSKAEADRERRRKEGEARVTEIIASEQAAASKAITDQIEKDRKGREKLLSSVDQDPRVQYERRVAAMARGEKVQDADLKDLPSLNDPSLDPAVAYEKAVAVQIARVRQIERQKTENFEKAQLNARQAAYSQAAGNFAAATDEMARQSVEAFWFNKALRISEAGINAWMAYSNTLASPFAASNPITAQVLAASQLAAGLAAVANIATAQPPGRAAGGQAGRGGLYEVAERGPELLSIGSKSFLLMGGKDGRVSPADTANVGGPRVTVNVHNAPGTTSTVRQGGTANAPTIDVMVEQVEQAIAAGVRRGDSPVARAGQDAYGWNRARGAR